MALRDLCRLAGLLLLVSGCAHSAAVRPPETIRAVVIGGVVETGLWEAVTQRFTAETGHRVEVVASGPKRSIATAFLEGECDLITMHASDTIVNLVADGHALDPQPWLKNDLVIVGPPDDPAGIRGMKDAGAALARIVERNQRFVVHSSLGAQEVLRAVLESADVVLDEQHTTSIVSDRARRVLQIAAEGKAYTLVGRIPFLSGKMPNANLQLMVQGDPRLRRPYLVAVANPARFPGTRYAVARLLADYLRSEATQTMIATWGRGKLDEYPVFFRIANPRSP